MTRGDRILVIVLAVLALLFTPAALALADGQGSQEAVITGPAGATTVRLDVPRRLVVEGRVTPVVVVVEDGGVRVQESGCPDHVCVRSGVARTPGAAIVCIPNGVSVLIGGERRDAPDAIVR